MAKSKIKVACLGDSITQGSGKTYPIHLQELLGDEYEVCNFGRGGAPMRKITENSYWRDSNYLAALEYKPDIVLFMLGTNDVWKDNFEFIGDYFKKDYKEMINILRNLESKPKIYLATSPTAYELQLADDNGINVTIRRLQLECAAELGLPVIDMNTLTAGKRESFPDGLHGNDSGYLIIAQAWYKWVFGGKLSRVTVRTEPGARVLVDEYIKVADAWGVADMEMTDGQKNVEIMMDGFRSFTSEVEINGDSMFDFPLVKGETIISHGCAATASSVTGNNTPEKAFDGRKTGTRWESQSEDPSWLVCDLGKMAAVAGVRIYWEGAFASKYRIETSEDGESWKIAAEITNASGGLIQHNFAPTDARYIRMFGTARGTFFAYSIFEMDVLAAD